jgi:hypothetical protein
VFLGDGAVGKTRQDQFKKAPFSAEGLLEKKIQL